MRPSATVAGYAPWPVSPKPSLYPLWPAPHLLRLGEPTMNVAVLGASGNPDRYSYQAVKKLSEKGHVPLPVRPDLEEIEGIPVYKSLRDIADPVDTITVYLSAARSSQIADDIVAHGARRVIFNPGAENPELSTRLRAGGMEVMEACTLVLLSTNQF